MPNPERHLPVLVLVLLSGLSGLLEAAEYRVQPGDTLTRIARQQWGAPERWREIADLNGLSEPYTLETGQLLQLPETASSVEPPPPPADPLETPSPTPPDRFPTEPPAAETPPHAPENRGEKWSWLDSFMDRYEQWLVLIGLCVIFLTLVLRAACWFSLVESSLPQCLVLMGLLTLATVLGLGACEYALHRWPESGLKALMWVLLGYAGIQLLLVKAILRCPWRSVVTVGVMSVVISVGLQILTALLTGLFDEGRSIIVWMPGS